MHVFTKSDSDSLVDKLKQLGGWLDGGVPGRLIVLTIPVIAGFAKIEALLNHWVAENGPAEWFYGNVYDPADGVTPLGWWDRPSGDRTAT